MNIKVGIDVNEDEETHTVMIGRSRTTLYVENLYDKILQLLLRKIVTLGTALSKGGTQGAAPPKE